MKNIIVDIKDISKYYGKYTVLDKVSFPIVQGEICGLVGENGAGKTTLLRILCRLIKQSSGQIQQESALKIGSLIESPALYLHLSARDNLTYLGKQLGLKELDKHVQKILTMIGLADVPEKKKAKNFSLGMRQRLAIGLAILDFPDLLILDEPINGLDPVGIKEVRELMLRLKESYNMTILVSSHILSELELVADKFVILSKGRVIKIESPKDLHSRGEASICFATSDNTEMQHLLDEKGIDYHVDDTYLILKSDIKPMDLISLAQSVHLDVQEVFYKQTSFENYYLNLIGGK